MFKSVAFPSPNIEREHFILSLQFNFSHSVQSDAIAASLLFPQYSQFYTALISCHTVGMVEMNA